MDHLTIGSAEWIGPICCVTFSGVFLTNAVPHLVSGLMGRPFQSPFAKPPGEGLSSSTVNVLWGFFNLVIGYLLVCRVGNFGLTDTPDVVGLGAGALIIALLLARHFGRFNGGGSPSRGRLLQSQCVSTGLHRSPCGAPCRHGIYHQWRNHTRSTRSNTGPRWNFRRFDPTINRPKTS
jgi:hypothetical protein